MARTIVGEAYIQILPTDGGVTAGVQKIIDGLPGQVEVPVTAETEQASSAVAQLSGQIETQIGESWQRAALQAGAFTAAVLGVRAAVEGVVNQLAGLFDQLAQAQAGFSAILGSESAGGRLLDDIREFARVSPFVTQELVNYSQQLLGVGQAAESIVPLLRSTGDLIASVGGDTQNISRVLFTLTQIRSIGRLVGQDAIQLQSALIPITKLLADFLGKTTAEVKKLQEQGAISADTVFAAIQGAGEKVEGAMANATRNISGARSVLQDTVEIMLQDSQTLNAVFEDLVQGILAFSDALGENESLQRDIDAIDRSLFSLYESLQPLLTALSETGSSLALNSLSILASSLEVLATALNAIPEGALELIGRGLAILFALRAPLALITYAQRLAEIGNVLRSDNVGQGLQRTATGMAATGAAAEASVGPLTRVNNAINAHVKAVGFAALAAGIFVSAIADENEALERLGQTLSGAGIGAQLGSAFGPQGALIGLAAGAGVGFVTSFVSSAREEAARKAAEIEEIGAEAAQEFLAGFQLSTPDIDTTADFTRFFSEIEPIQDQLRQTTEELEALRAERDRLLGEGQNYVNDPSAGLVFQTSDEDQLAKLQAITDEIENFDTAAETARATLYGDEGLFNSGAFNDAATSLATRLGELKRDSEAYAAAVDTFVNTQFPETGGIFDTDLSDDTQRAVASMVLLGERTVTSGEDLELFRGIAEATGVSIDQLLVLPLNTLVDILEGKVPEGVAAARAEIQTLQTAFDEAKKGMEEFFKPFVDRVNAAQAALQAQQGLTSATEKFVADQTAANALALGESLLKMTQQIATASEAAFEGTGSEAGVSFLAGQLEVLQEQLDLTDVEMQELIQSMGIMGSITTGVDPAFTGTLEELAEQTGLSVDRLREILPSIAELGATREINIPINIVEKLEELATITEGLRNMPNVGKEVIAELESVFLQLDLLGAITPQLDAVDDRLKQSRELVNTFVDIEAQRFERSPEYIEGRARQQRVDIDAAAEAARLEAEKEAERLQKEAERLAKEAEREAERIQREAEQAQREAERLAEEQRREQERLREALKDSSELISSSMERASNEIASAAEQLTLSLRERVQDEQAVSVGRLIRNASDQASRVAELDQGLAALQGRGLSEDAIGALGLNNIADIRQLRRLLSASDTDLAELNRLITLRDSNAEALARRQRQEETQATIVAAIIQAATILGYEISPDAARQLALTFNITGNAEGLTLPTGIIDQIQNAGVLLRT